MDNTEKTGQKQAENTLESRISRLESDMRQLFEALLEYKKLYEHMAAALTSTQTNVDTLAAASYTLGENDKNLGQAVKELQRVSGLPIRRAEPGQPN